MNNISEQLENLPRGIYDILLSNTNADTNEELANKHQVDLGDFVDFISEVYVNKTVSQLLSLVMAKFKLTPEKSLSLVLDIAGYKLLLADDYFAGQVSKFITDNKGDLVLYQKITDGLRQKIGGEILKWNVESKVYEPEAFVPTIDENNLAISPEAEKNFLLDIFLNKLPEFLNTEREIIEDINDSLILLLIDNPQYIQEFKDALLKSSAQLLKKQITIDGRLIEASVSNLIKDFIKDQGSAVFGAMELSKYLISGSNALSFSEVEKNLVRQLLKTYRNLFFFPESLQNLAVEAWEIIPLTENSVVPQTKKKDDQVDDISVLMAKYRQESLEYKALEEEARKKKN
jgi:hypothetical protein